MTLPETLRGKGFALAEVCEDDLHEYLHVKKACYQIYVDQYFGGWVDGEQIKMNTGAFWKMRGQSCFRKVLLGGQIVGFLAYDELPDRIGGISIQMVEKARNMGLGTFYISEVIRLSVQSTKPVHLKVFKSNPAIRLYERAGFAVYDETPSHYLMKYTP